MRAVPTPNGTLAVASIGGLITAIDSGVLSTAIPSLQAEFGGSVGQLEWTTNAYNLAFGCLLIVAASLGDRFGRRLTLSLGLGVFGLASVAAALAPSLTALIVARAFQGAGAAAILPLTLTVISEAFPLSSRGRAIGMWSGVLAAGGVFGSVVSGVLIQLTGWRGAFWINVPIIAVLIPLMFRYVAESRGSAKSVDMIGLGLCGLGSLGIISGLTSSTEHGWLSLVVLVPLAVGIALLCAFAAWERRASEPMIPPSLLRNWGFSAATLMIFCLWGSLALCVFLTSQFFQVAQGDSPLVAGLKFSIWPLPVALVPMLGGRLLARFPRHVLIPVGMALHALGLIGLALAAAPKMSYLFIAIAMVVSGIGLGIANSLVSAQTMSTPPQNLLGVASGVSNSLRQFGGVLGVAIGAAAFAAGGGSYRSPLDFTDGFRPALWAAVAIAGLGVAISLFGVPRPALSRVKVSIAQA